MAIERYSPLRIRHLPFSWFITRLESPWMVTRPGGRGARYFNTWRTPAYSATLLDMVLPFPTKPYSFKRTVLLPSLTTTPNVAVPPGLTGPQPPSDQARYSFMIHLVFCRSTRHFAPKCRVRRKAESRILAHRGRLLRRRLRALEFDTGTAPPPVA